MRRSSAETSSCILASRQRPGGGQKQSDDMKMKTLASFACVLLIATTVPAQDVAPPTPARHARNAAIGWEISSFANNYGFGGRFDTPSFAKGQVHVQIAASVAWVQGVREGESDTTWAPYTLLRFGIVRTMPIGTRLRFYGGGGLALV